LALAVLLAPFSSANAQTSPGNPTWARTPAGIEAYPVPTPVSTVGQVPEVPRLTFGNPNGPPTTPQQNEAVRLSLMGSDESADVFGRRADPGQAFLVLAVRWENIHPKQQVEKDRLEGKVDRTGGVGAFARGETSADKEYVDLDVAYRVPQMVDHAYALVDGQAIPLDPVTEELPGGIPLHENFDLPKQGDVRETPLAFRIPAGAENVAFQFFDYQYGNLLIPVRGNLEAARGAGGPGGAVLAEASTDMIQLAAHSLAFQDTFDGEGAGPGRTWAVVTLGGKSLATTGGSRAIVEIDPSEYLWVSTDGGYIHYGRAPGSLERGVLRFTPEVYQQQQVAFRVPADARRLSLGARIQREVVTLDLTDRSPEGMPRGEETLEDGDALEVRFFGTRTEGDLVIVDLGIRPLVQGQGVEIRAGQQFFLVTEEGEARLDTAATAVLVRGPPDPFVVPPGTDLRFEIAFPAGAAPRALRYRGFRTEGRIGF
jgi:hypothetical protein